MEEFHGLGLGGETCRQFRLHLGTGTGGEHRRDAEGALAVEVEDLPFTFHDDADRDALHTACAQARLNLAPEHGAELITHQAIQHTAGLLGIHEVDIDLARVGDGLHHRRLGDLVEGDALHLAVRQFQRFLQVPADGFPFAVFVGREPDGGGLVGFLLELLEAVLLIVGDDVGGLETVLHIHTEVAFGEVPHVAVAAEDGVALTQVLLDGLGLGRRLHDDQIAALLRHICPNRLFPPNRCGGFSGRQRKSA